MTITVRTLTQRPELQLRCLAGHAGLDAPIRWVHVSEVEDPTPWLKGGEFLMTTALAARDDEAVETFFRRLSATGLAGLGFGTGVTFEQVPQLWLRLADIHRLPLLEAPITTPYVAISELVSHHLAQAQQESIQRTLDVQRDLTKAALRRRDGNGVLDLLVKAIKGWAVVADLSGSVRAARPASARSRLAEFQRDLARCRDAPGGAAVSVTGPDENVLIQQLGAADRVRNLLVVGKPGEFSPYERMIVSGAITLLSLVAEHAHNVTPAERWFRDRLTVRLVDGEASIEERTQALSELGFSSPGLQVAYVDVATPLDAGLATAIEEHFTTHGIACLAGQAAGDGGTWVIAQSQGDLTAAALARLVDGLQPAGRAGLGRVVTADELHASAQQARLAFDVTQRRDQTLAIFDDLAFPDLLPGIIPEASTSMLAASFLAPLDRADPAGAAGLRHTLRAFLAANGVWEHAAERLGVHRHTLRNRITRIEQLLDVDMSSMDVRVALWLALSAG